MKYVTPTTPESWDALGKALTEARDRMVEIVAHDMTLEMARAVRRLRCEDGCTWGRIGETAGGGQILGREMCYRAAVLLGENPHEEPWN